MKKTLITAALTVAAFTTKAQSGKVGECNYNVNAKPTGTRIEIFNPQSIAKSPELEFIFVNYKADTVRVLVVADSQYKISNRPFGGLRLVAVEEKGGGE